MRTAVTGATGFIGRHLVRALVDRGDRCRCLVRDAERAKDFEELGSDGVELVEGDITRPETLNDFVKDAEAVYHLAGMGHVTAFSEEAYRQFTTVNVEGTSNLLKACMGSNIKRFVHFSSTAAVGLVRADVVSESTPPEPRTPYQKSKLEGERVVLRFHGEENVPAVILRPCMVYGPGAYDGEFLKICRLVKRGRFPKLGKGRNLSPIVHVSDVVRGALMAAEKGVPGEAYFLVENSYPMAEIGEEVARALGGVERVNWYLPLWVAKPGAALLEMISHVTKKPPVITRQNIESTVWDRVFSTEKAERELGWKPEISLREGVLPTVKWYREKYLI